MVGYFQRYRRVMKVKSQSRFIILFRACRFNVGFHRLPGEVT